ncbi:MAG: cyclopropane-fatty-acyl-phospholipid synthase family protein [Candidatus Omnitrophota bacterium]|nr:cyclopropane-fatty-acyl-phospholipid synthase family protein [Candidatus Omnitrophota bacterium]
MWYEGLLTHGFIPDFLIRIGIRRQLREKLRQESLGGVPAQLDRRSTLLDELRHSPIAIATAEANAQHYEVPAEFFRLVLGGRLKYSCGYWEEGDVDLDASEEAMLGLCADRARIKDGYDILDLGCGWGSLTLFLAEKFPDSCITGVSNSRTQKMWIETEAKRRNLKNVKIITADMNTFSSDCEYDRIFSIEMFEHMRNYEQLFHKVSSWLKNDGLLFVHVFCHKTFPYLYPMEDDGNWMARHFFTGGTMPSEDLFLEFQEDVRLRDLWQVSGSHYEKTCKAWLEKMDSCRREIEPLFQQTYGKEAKKWWAYWRVFFMACAELFGYHEGAEWYVAHYLFEKQPQPTQINV